MELLKSAGHEVHLAVSINHAAFLDNLNIKYHLLSDIQETDNGGFPSFKWFSNIENISRCIEAEVALIKKIKPDRILGVFRFTLYASAQIANVPYDSLICGCMIPESQEILGFKGDEPDANLQQTFLNNFFRFAGKKLSLALKKFGLTAIDDIRCVLKGERTFLWDFPEFMPLEHQPNIIHVGPISLHHWPYDSVDLDPILDSNNPIAVISFGTCVTDSPTVLRIIELLLDLDYKVIVAAGGQREMACIKPSDPRVVFMNYAPLHKIFPHTSLLVTHGGQMTVFEALQHKIPVLVMPLQPEQAHNGVCLERIGCGKRLIPATAFSGFPEDYLKVFQQRSADDLKAEITSLITNPHNQENLTKIKQAIDNYHGAQTLIKYLG